MSFYTDWLIAGEHEAEAVLSILTTEERAFEDWPHLSLKSIGQMDLMTLWAAIRQEHGQLKSTLDDPVAGDTEEGPLVCRVEATFVSALARVQDADIDRLVEQWRQTDGLSDREPTELTGLLHEIRDFAKTAEASGKPVLELVVLE